MYRYPSTLYQYSNTGNAVTIHGVKYQTTISICFLVVVAWRFDPIALIINNTGPRQKSKVPNYVMVFGLKKSMPQKVSHANALAQIVPELVTLYTYQQKAIQEIKEEMAVLDTRTTLLPGINELQLQLSDLESKHTLVNEQNEDKYRQNLVTMDHELTEARLEANKAKALVEKLMVELDACKLQQQQSQIVDIHRIAARASENSEMSTLSSKTTLPQRSQLRRGKPKPLEPNEKLKGAYLDFGSSPSPLPQQHFIAPVHVDRTPIHSNKSNRRRWTFDRNKTNMEKTTTPNEDATSDDESVELLSAI